MTRLTISYTEIISKNREGKYDRECNRDTIANKCELQRSTEGWTEAAKCDKVFQWKRSKNGVRRGFSKDSSRINIMQKRAF